LPSQRPSVAFFTYVCYRIKHDVKICLQFLKIILMKNLKKILCILLLYTVCSETTVYSMQSKKNQYYMPTRKNHCCSCKNLTPRQPQTSAEFDASTHGCISGLAFGCVGTCLPLCLLTKLPTCVIILICCSGSVCCACISSLFCLQCHRKYCTKKHPEDGDIV